MLEGVKSRGLGVRVLLVMAAMVLAMFAANALYNAPGLLGTKKAEADHYGNTATITGTVTYSSGSSAYGATVAVYRWPSGIECQPMFTAFNGKYTCRNVAPGHSYCVVAQSGNWLGRSNNYHERNQPNCWFSVYGGRVVTANVIMRYGQS